MRYNLIIMLAVSLSACGDADRSRLTESDLSSRLDISAVDFGTDDGDFTGDGECDDARFRGPGMTDTLLLDEDVMSDASDCRTAYADGEIILIDK